MLEGEVAIGWASVSPGDASRDDMGLAARDVQRDACSRPVLVSQTR